MRRGLRLLLVTVMVCTLLTGCGNVETAALETMSKSETETEKAENKTDTSDWPTVTLGICPLQEVTPSIG